MAKQIAWEESENKRINAAKLQREKELRLRAAFDDSKEGADFQEAQHVYEKAKAAYDAKQEELAVAIGETYAEYQATTAAARQAYDLVEPVTLHYTPQHAE